jgi:DNA polymerase III delta subunit
VVDTATFLQWLNSYPSKKRLLYVCGEDKALVFEVLQKELASRPLNDLDYVTLDGKGPLADITAALEEFSTTGYRVVVVQNAEHIKDWDKIIEWASDKEMKRTTLICVGSDVKPNTKLPQFRMFFDKGKFIECRPLSEENLIKYVLSRGRFTKEASVALVKRTNGSSARILNELHKFEYLPAPVTAEQVATYVEVSASEQLVEALFENKKSIAMQIATDLDEASFRFVLGALEYNLSNLVLFAFVKDKNATATDIADRSGIPVFLIGKYFLWSKGLTNTVLYKRIKLLANADAQYRKGLTAGVLERMVVLW